MGMDKAWLPLPEGPLLPVLASRLLRVVDEVLVAARPGQELPPLPGGVRRIDDAVPDDGPFAAVASILPASSPRDLFLLACDHPGFDPSTAIAMRGVERQAPAVLIELSGHALPTHAWLRPAGWAPLLEQRARGVGGLQRALVDLGAAVVREEHWRALGWSASSFLDTDSPEDFHHHLVSSSTPSP
jgi:molybdopterin-guanine dinucleotide biosynthesis protein A